MSLSLVLTLLFVLSGLGVSRADNVTDSLMRELDQAVENRAQYIKERKDRLRSLRWKAQAETDPVAKFSALGHLLDDYNSFNTDSSLLICRERLDIADGLNNRELQTHARLDMANVLGVAGLYKESLEIVDSIPRGEIPSYLVPFYYHIRRTVYGFMADYAIRKGDKEHYSRLTSQYRDSLIAINEEGSIYRALIEADKLNSENRPKESLSLLLGWIAANPNAGIHDRAILAYTLSEAYGLVGDREHQKQQLIISAIADMESGVMEYVSLRKLALLLYEDGDIERTYRYLRQCLDDAVECNARLRQLETGNIFSVVNDVYLNTIERQRRRLMVYIGLISVLAVAMFFAYYFALRQMRRARRARKEVDEANSRLLEMNDEQKELIGRLRSANREIAEASRVKEVYIAEYMNQCSSYIDRLDTIRKKIGNKIASGASADMKAMMKSLDSIDDDLKSFYEHFDNTFLMLFPTFVEDFNALLAPDKRIDPKVEGRLNTELRIFALIRLGITDSAKIAQFLRYSLTTIYNYRTKVRNRALGDRDELERKVMVIGGIQ